MVFQSLKNIFRSKLFLVLFLALIIILLGLFVSSFFHSKAPVSTTPSTGTPTPTIKINASNFESEVAKNYVIAALPSDAILSLRLYHYTDAGQIVYDRDYTIMKSYVKTGLADNADITLGIPTSYLASLTNKNFCSIIQKSKNDGSLIVDSSLSAVSLAWKFRDVLKYKSCFGM